jgi:hypothetical protein
MIHINLSADYMIRLTQSIDGQIWFRVDGFFYFNSISKTSRYKFTWNRFFKLINMGFPFIVSDGLDE